MAAITFSELEFQNTLGRGAQGTVHKGEWKTKHQIVAIKQVLGKIKDEEVSWCKSITYFPGASEI